METFPTEQSCIDHLEKLLWPNGAVSPFSSDSKVYKCAGGRYKCRNSGKYFNVRIGTIFEDTKIPLQKWFLALYIFSSHKKGISSHQLGRDITVTQRTAWFMLHRLRYAFQETGMESIFSGEIEVDETYYGGDYKNKHSDKKLKGSTGRSLNDKTPIIGIKERESGMIVAQKIKNTKKEEIIPVIVENVEVGSMVYTDEWKSYKPLPKNGYRHQKVSHSAKQFVNGMAHVNGVENFWSHLKRGIDGIYHSVSHEHLDRYVREFVFRFNTRKDTTNNRFNLAIKNPKGKLTYKKLIAK